MAIVPRIAQLKIIDTTGLNSIQWLAIATTQDLPAGSSVVVTITRTDVGATTNLTADTLTLNYYDGRGLLIEAVTLNAGSFSQTDTFFFTHTGNTGGNSRCGTVEIALRATKTTGLTATNYDVESDGTPNTPPTGGSTVLDRGWIRGTTTLSENISNISLGGGKLSPVKYAESLFIRLTLGSVSYLSNTIGVTVSNTTPSLSGNTNSIPSTTRSVTFLNVVDNRFPANLTAVTITETLPLSTFTGLSDFAITSTTPDTINVDPRITFSQLLQVNDNVFGTTPDTKNVVNGKRLSADLGFIAARSVSSRGEGVNGLVWTAKLWDSGNLVGSEASPVKTRTVTSTTQGTALGWSDAFIVWDNTLPAGGWTQKAIITTTNAIGLEVTNTRNLTLIASDPRIHLIISAGDTTSPGKHWSPGESLTVGGGVINNGLKSVFDAGTMKFLLLRFNPSLGTTEYLKNDLSAWVTGDAPDAFTMSPSPGDAKLGLYTFTPAQTATFNLENLILIAQVDLNSTPYFGRYILETLDTKNPHDLNQFDPTGLYM